MDDEQLSTTDWKELKLSLERPYKNDEGNKIQPLLDIVNGQFVFEPPEEWDATLGDRFNRIFAERGIDFFDLDSATRYKVSDDDTPPPGEETDDKQVNNELTTDGDVQDQEPKPMTPEMLFKMRMELLPRLHVALGEMTQARDLLSLLLSASGPTAPISITTALTGQSEPTSSALPPSLDPGSLTASTVTPQPPILSLQAFNTQLVTGGKDDALRKASDVLQAAADSIDRSTSRAESYWMDALHLRRANWGLVPAPLPPGSSTGKGADKTSRDFLVSYSLESSPPYVRQSGIAHMPFYTTLSSEDGPLVFPFRNKTRLRVSLIRRNNESITTCHSHIRIYPTDTLNGALKDAQKESVDREIFSELVKEAGLLPTASTRVSERLIVIDASQNVEVRFELIDQDLIETSNASAGSSSDISGNALCDLIASTLPLLLLRQHTYLKSLRLGTLSRATRPIPPRILQPIIDLLQYQVFLQRVRKELVDATSRLNIAGVRAKLRFEGVCETGQMIVESLKEGKEKLNGEAILGIDERHNLRLTFNSPSTLMVHLPHATMAIVSIQQLTQLLMDETKRTLHARICEIGVDVCGTLKGTWFVDEIMNRAVGRWEGCALNFEIKCLNNRTLDCHANQILRAQVPAAVPPISSSSFPQTIPLNTSSVPVARPTSTSLHYSSRTNKSLGLFDWIKMVVDETLSKS